MADQHSARPMGESVSCTRSGSTFKSLQSMTASTPKRALGAVLLAIAGAHIALSGFNTNDAGNALWPALFISYSLLFATWSILPDGWFPSNTVSSENNGNFETHTFVETSSHSDLEALHEAPFQNFIVPVQDGARLQSPQSQCSDWTDLMSQVSHELRTPLNAMIGFSDVMNAELLGPLENPKYREYLAHIRDSGQELLKSAEDTLAMTSLLANRPALEDNIHTIDLCGTLTEAWKFVADDARMRDITLDLDCCCDVIIAGEGRPLKQTFINLFSEALKRTDDNSQVIVRVQQKGEVVEVEVSAQSGSDMQAKLASSLSVAIAQALLELQGTTLVTAQDANGKWSAVTLFDCPLQADFFTDTEQQPVDAPPLCTDGATA